MPWAPRLLAVVLLAASGRAREAVEGRLERALEAVEESVDELVHPSEPRPQHDAWSARNAPSTKDQRSSRAKARRSLERRLKPGALFERAAPMSERDFDALLHGATSSNFERRRWGVLGDFYEEVFVEQIRSLSLLLPRIGLW